MGFRHLIKPLLVTTAHPCNHLRMSSRDLVLFARVGFEVIEFRAVHQFVALGAKRAISV